MPSLPTVISALVAASLLAVSCGAKSPHEPPADNLEAPAPSRPDILLVTLDTTRADHLGCYSSPQMATPHLDRFSRRAALMETAISSVPITLPSHTVMLTGLYPIHTGVHDNGIEMLAPSKQTLAEILKKAGYHTSAFISAAVLEHHFGLSQGFDLYDDDLRRGPKQVFHYRERRASATNQAVITRVRNIEHPSFLFVHYYDPHHPYQPEPPFSLYAPAYQGEIAATDWAFGELASRLRRRGLSRDAITIVAGDHGESLGDHGEMRHGIFVYDSTIRLPLLVSGMDGLPPLTSHPVALADIMPSILSRLGLTASGTDGRPFAKAPPHRAIYVESELPRNSHGWSPLRALRTDRYLVIEAPRREVYDLDRDPGEVENLAASDNAQAKRLFSELASLSSSSAGRSHANLPPEVEANLRELGYVSRQTVSGGQGDPKDLIGLVDLIEEAEGLMEEEPERAAVLLESAIAKSPKDLFAIQILGHCLNRTGNYARAEKLFRRGLKLQRSAELREGLAVALALSGRTGEATKEFQEAERLNPRFEEAYLNHARLELKLGREREAAAVLDRALVSGVRSPAILKLRGKLEAEHGDPKSAVKLLEEAQSRDPRDGETAIELAKALYRTGAIDQAIASYAEAARLLPQNTAVLRALMVLTLRAKHDPVAAEGFARRILEITSEGPAATAARKLLAEIER